MRKCAPWLVFLLGLALACPALAQDDDWDDWESELEDEGGGLGEYGSSVGNRYLVGINSLATFLADPVMSTVDPREEFDELPLAPVTKYPVGLVQGLMLMTHRAYTGVLDVAFAPLTPFKMLSPQPRYKLFSGAEHEVY